MENTILKVNAITAALLSTLMVPQVFAAEANDVREQLESIEVIMVYGEKRERSLKDTTSSVSVITEEALKSLQNLTVSEAISDIANVVVLSGSAPDIRGVSGNGAAGGFNSISGGAKARVSTLIDGVVEPFVADLTGDSGIWDIEQIEVFRGPQSTNNGRNSIGGALYIKTKDPTFYWEGAARVGYRNKNNYVDTSIMASGPIIDDELAFRVAAQRLDGESVNNGLVYENNPINFDQNEVKTNRLKTKLLWKPANIEDFSALLAYSNSSEKGDTGRSFYTGDNPWDFVPITQRYMNTESDSISLKLDYKINDSMSIDLLMYHLDYKFGFDTYEKSAARQSQVRVNETDKMLDAKINFGLNNDQFNGFVGLAHFDRKQDLNSRGATIYDGIDSSDSTAIYGELYYALTDAWKIIVGGRIEDETQKRNFNMQFKGTLLEAQLDNNKRVKLPKLALQYELSDNTMLSVSGRRGYNAGGGAITFVTSEYYYYEPETVNTYELSSRSSFNDGKINVSANIFYNDYNNYQATSSTRKIINMDDAITYGLELETSAMLTDNFQLNAALGLLSTEITDAGEEFADSTGNELNSAPSFTAKVGGRYWLTEMLNVGVSANYIDEYYGDFANTQERVAGGYLLTRINVNYETDNWLVTAFVNNIQDQEEVTSIEPANRRYPTGYAAIVDPRNVGLSATYSF